MSNPFKYNFFVKVENSKPLVFSNVKNKEDEPFLDLSFNILNNAGMGIKNANISIFNLAESTYMPILKEYTQTKKKVAISLEISSKEGVLPSITFSGTCRRVGLERPDNTLTEIVFDAFDGGNEMLNAISNFSINKGATILELKKEYANTLGLDFFSKSSNDYSILSENFTSNTKNVFDELKEVFRNQDVFIDNQKIYFLDDNYYNNLSIAGKLFTLSLSEKTGLQSVPKPAGHTLEVEHRILPNIKRGQLLNIEIMSGIDKRFNGLYKVVGFQHKGLISYVRAQLNNTMLELRRLNNALL